MKKIGLICLALVLALGALGVGYAQWSETLDIGQNTVETGELHWELTEFTILDYYDPATYPIVLDWNIAPGFVGSKYLVGKNVGWAEGVLVDSDDDGDDDTLELTLHNVYPSYFNEVTVQAQNTGTIPIVFQRVVIEGNEITSEPAPVVPLDLNGDDDDDIEILWKNALGSERLPGQPFPAMTFWFHVLQDAPEGETLSFTIEIVGVQWNLYP